jgi:hypothetical protein
MQYPEDWQKVGESTTLRANINNITILAAFQPADKSVIVSIEVEKLVENQALDQFIQNYIATLSEYDLNPKIIEQNRTTTQAGIHGYKLVHNGTVDAAEIVREFSEDDPILQSFLQLIDWKPADRTTMSFVTIHGNNTYFMLYSDATAGILDQLCAAYGEVMPECTLFTSIDDPYSHYLPIAQKMIQPFEIIPQNQTNACNNSSMVQNGTANEDPCSIINIRLAKGEIPIEEYQRLREIFLC